ncbi:hypothetical protein KKA93_01945 [Patescibacteria group bacterium]|nr:hypothetical protein [Patescibacteria group bacterium]MBU1663380.1 hypothetical protein [Patescibacteria group bacterium]MBU1934331.1 hypothetical protein [Patescibacteria group bacterium]MBU2007622.1 hypothetical protein [Patescibacteria group bacterium]MBU2233369.1 hypothetical protein [Patescibacteria group bacterium]
MNNKLLNIVNSFLILICLTSVFGGFIYRFYSLNKLGLIISLILTVISFIIIQYFYLISNKKTRRFEKKTVDKKDTRYCLSLKIFSAGAYLLTLILCFYILFNHQTAAAIVSPWQIAPKYFFIVYSLATLFLIGNAIVNKKFALPLIMFHYFLSFSIALIIYKLGYGYDPFIHQATENLIDKTGAVEPKPFYYLGQYAIVVIIHKITAMPIVWLDKIILPLLAALFLPITLWRVLKSWFDSVNLNLILILALLALGFPFLIITTPQNLAYFLLILAILSGLICKNYYDYLIILLLSSTSAITHPVAGIPALIFCAFLAVYHSDKAKIKKYFYPILIIITIFILPALFYFLNTNLSAAATSHTLIQRINPLRLNIPGQENFILNFVYFYGFNLKFILASLTLMGIFIAWKHQEQCKILWLYLTLSTALFTSYLITAKLPFAFLINYERDDYPQRILLAACLFLLPFFILSIYVLLEKIAKQNTFVIVSFSVFLSLVLSACLYMTYPRYDNYFNSHGYSVSSADINAVNWINENAKTDFIVLANQQVSAAALSQFGFKKYYGDGQIFYYPIPTSSPLYQYYLDMVYKKPSRETMLAVMNLVGVNQGYFVLNKYWRAFTKILDQAKLSADSWEKIDNGEVYVFKYEKK